MTYLPKTRGFCLGLRDGWRQPLELSSSANVDHLSHDDAQEWLDRGINIGQLARKGRKSQTYTERYWPLKNRDGS